MKSKKKIICIANDFWANSDEEWGFNLMKQNGYQVELWRIGELMGFTVFESLQFEYPVKHFKTHRELYFCIARQKMKDTLFLRFYGCESLHLGMAEICLLGGKYYVIDFSATNILKHSMLYEKKIKSTKRHWMDYFLPAYSFLGSRHNLLSVKSSYQIEHGNNVYLHTYDYDVFLRQKRCASQAVSAEKPYILFIDQNFFDHKDLKNGKVKKWIPDEEQFIAEMRRFLEQVEAQFDMPVVVSAHPITAGRIKEIYGERKIVYGDTCGYTKNAELVISCCSGAIGFAVMHGKPILLYNNFQLRRSMFYMDMQMPKARVLKAKIVDISRDPEEMDLKQYVTKPDYKEYMEYLTADVNDERLFMDVVVQYLNTL